ncbi:ABC transporter permease [Actinoplanes sp. NPDC049118]|uniref:ABC transporter permease n=1 Tax=Actinoplanes sp. NPDC049118 TaxID=3155769 RepID=UPI0033E03482
MTAVQQAPAGAADVAPERDGGRTGIPLRRLTQVELRKLADTRAGLWLLIVIGLAAAATAAIMIFAAPDAEQTFQGFLSFGLVPASVLLPVLGILSMTSEWSQRTALTTFTLEPRRGRVVAAKLIAAVLIAVATTAAAAALSAAGNLIAIGTGGDGDWHIEAALVGQLLVNQLVFVLMGSAFGALLMNSPLAIVLYFAIPTVWSVLGEMVRWLRTAAGWIDINLTSVPLSEPGMTGEQWARFGVAALVWVALPLALGTVRVLRREVS